jgi:hypothetical protein
MKCSKINTFKEYIGVKTEIKSTQNSGQIVKSMKGQKQAEIC